jgi:hypothetical protein
MTDLLFVVSAVLDAGPQIVDFLPLDYDVHHVLGTSLLVPRDPHEVAQREAPLLARDAALDHLLEDSLAAFAALAVPLARDLTRVDQHHHLVGISRQHLSLMSCGSSARLPRP